MNLNQIAVRRRPICTSFSAGIFTAALAALLPLTSHSKATDSKIVQTFEKPMTQTFSGGDLAQVSLRKSPSMASDTTTSVPSLSDSGSTATANTSQTTDTVFSIPDYNASSTTGSASSGTASTTSSTSSGQTLEDILLSLPPIGYDDALTTSFADLLGTTYTSSLDLDTSFTESPMDYRLPDISEAVTELDSLTSTSKSARKVSLMYAICRTLEANQSLQIDRLRPEISNTGIEQAEGEFDTVLDANVSRASRRSSTLGPKPKDGPDNRVDDTIVSRDIDTGIGLSGRLPTGTNYRLGLDVMRGTTNRTEPFYQSNLNLNITQNLLRGRGTEVNLVRVRTAENNFIISLYQLQNILINLVTEVQNAYYDLYLALKTLDIRRAAYGVAKEQRERTEEFVRVGRSAPLDALSAQAEEASRISDVINAAADLKRQALRFLQLLNPENLSTGWRSLIFPSEIPVLPSENLVAEERVRLGRYYRPDLRQAQLDLANGELEVVRTKNGLLPLLDFNVSGDLAGPGDSLGDSFSRIRDRDFPSYQVGLQFNYPLQNRTARAEHRRAQFQKRLAEEAIQNFCQIIDVEIRSAIIEIERTRRLIDSTKVTEALRVRELEAETEKFRVGRSTQILVSQVQRDLITAQLDTVASEVAHIKSYLALYRAEGTALQRRGIEPIHITPESGVGHN